jgi:hypothetical protein
MRIGAAGSLPTGFDGAATLKPGQRSSVVDDFDNQIQLDRQPLLPQRQGSSRFVTSVVVLAVIAVVCAYLWLNYGALFQRDSSAARRAALETGGEETVMLKDFQSFQRQTEDSLQAATRDIAAQKADLKSLSDQVSALTAKIDALRAAAGTGSLPAPTELRPGSEQPAARAPVIAARKKTSAPKTPGGSISVGGAPLPAAPPDGQ